LRCTGDRAVRPDPNAEEGMINKDAINVIAQATVLSGNEAALRAAIDEVIPPSLAKAGVQVFRLHGDIEKPGHFVL
jgi:quinol monooxygenase YgiN